MLSMLELFINGFVAFAVLPLAIASLATGSKPPEHSVLGKYYRAERHLMLLGNLLLLSIGAVAIAKLLTHFGFVGAELGEGLDTWLSVPLMGLVIIFLVFMVRAILKVRRAEAAE
ncbi:MAG: hypothetical protein J0H65_04275 [Rhizobiales bacterium]|nr:hypothetical protein [Hyphomicrobiales bacterium]